MANKSIVLNFEIKGVQQSITDFDELKKAISATEEELNSMDFGSDAFNKQKKQLDDLKDSYADLSKSAGDRAKESAEKFMGAADDFEKFAKGVTDAVSGIAIAMGASDEDTKALMESFIKFSSIATAVKGGVEAVIVVVKNWAAIQRVLNLVLLANPLGLIIAGVAALATGIYFLIKNIDTVIDFFSEWQNIALALLGPLGLLVAILLEVSEAEEEAADSAKKRAKENHDAYKQRLKDIDAEKEAIIKAEDEKIEAYELEKDTLEANGEASDEVTLKILESELTKTQAVLNANAKRLQAGIDYWKAQAALAGQDEETFKQNLKARGLDLEKAQEEANKILEKNQMAVQYSENAITKFKREQEEKRTADAKDAADKRNTIREKEYQEELKRLHRIQAEQITLLSDIEKAETDYYNSKLTKQQLDEQNANDYYFNLKTRIEQSTLDEETKNEKLALIEEAHQAKIAEIRQTYADDAAAKKKAQDEKDAEDAKKKADDEIAKAEAIFVAKQDIALKSAQSTISLAETVFTLTNAFGKQDEKNSLERAKRQFAITKALKISEAIISTIIGVQNALSAQSLLPEPIATIARVANAVAVGVAGAANIAKIASTKFNPGTSSGGGSSSVPANTSGGAAGGTLSSAPTAAIPNQQLFGVGNNKSNVTPFGQSTQTNQPQPIVIQNTISAAEMTTVQSDLAGIQTMATLSVGG